MTYEEAEAIMLSVFGEDSVYVCTTGVCTYDEYVAETGRTVCIYVYGASVRANRFLGSTPRRSRERMLCGLEPGDMVKFINEQLEWASSPGGTHE